MEKIILSTDHNFKVYEYRFRTEIIDSLIRFVLDCQQSIMETTYCEDHEILICMPNYIIEYMKEEHERLISNSSMKNNDIYFCGIKCQVSYENSITVFYNAYIPTKIIGFTKQL